MNRTETQAARTLPLQRDDRYRQLDAGHHQLDNRLHQLTEQPYLSTSEQLEEVTLKKRKLALKDLMADMARDDGKTSGRTP